MDTLNRLWQIISIVVLCIVAAVVYGICHDQITARICIEYFFVFHSTAILPSSMDPNSPTQQGFFWGVFATWWMGFFIGVPLSIVACVGSAKPLSARALVRPISWLLLTMTVCAFVSGLIGYFFVGVEIATRLFPAVIVQIPVAHQRGFVADYFAHNASYLVGSLGGFVLLIYVVSVRWRNANAPPKELVLK